MEREDRPQRKMEERMKPIPGSPRARFALAAALIVIAAVLSSQTTPREQVGPLPGGGVDVGEQPLQPAVLRHQEVDEVRRHGSGVPRPGRA